MKFFIDTAEVAEIRELAATGLVDGVTTNPSLIAKSGRKILDVIAEICDIVPGPISAEVAATDFDTMLAEGRKLAALRPNVAVKVPLTPAGLRTCKALADEHTAQVLGYLRASRQRDGMLINFGAPVIEIKKYIL